MATIVLDPGHYGSYNAGVCPGYYEGNTMLKLAQYLGAALSSYGANVRYTRTTNEQNPSLAQRGAMAAGADLFLSLHTDANDNPDARGVTSFFSVQRPESEPFASAIGEAVAKAMGNQFRGSVARPSETTPGVDYLGVLRAAVATGVPYAFLIEHGFHTNAQDCAVLSDDAGLQRIASAEAQVIAQWLGLSSSGGGCVYPYTVQTGESLYQIGQKFGVSWQTIAQANGIAAPYIIMPGQQLTVPLPTTGNCLFTYTVQPGEYLYLIGQKFGVPWQAIAEANGISAPYVVMPGQRIAIPLPVTPR